MAIIFGIEFAALRLLQYQKLSHERLRDMDINEFRHTIYEINQSITDNDMEVSIIEVEKILFEDKNLETLHNSV